MKKIIPILCILLFPLLAVAQLPLLDITLEARDASTLEVKVRPDQNFNGLLSNLQFTIRWAATGDIHLNNPVFNSSVNLLIYPQKAGAEVEESGYRYQKFGGVGMNPLNTMNVSWTAGEEVVLLEIPVLNASAIVAGDFEISTDAKTLDNDFNGVFYAELDAKDRTGNIYQNVSVTSVDPMLSARHSFDRIFPNPASHLVTMDFTLETPGEVNITLYNELGQVVSSKKINGINGANQLDWDVTELAAGVYQVGLTHQEITLNQKLVVVH